MCIPEWCDHFDTSNGPKMQCRRQKVANGVFCYETSFITYELNTQYLSLPRSH